jgi:hypothetical protein
VSVCLQQVCSSAEACPVVGVDVCGEEQKKRRVVRETPLLCTLGLFRAVRRETVSTVLVSVEMSET